MAVESTFHKTHCGKPFNKAFYCAQRAIRLHQVPKIREGVLIPLSTGGFRGFPPSFFLILCASMCVFNGFFMHLGPDFRHFGHDLLLEKIFLVTRETKCWTKLFSDSHDFFTFFLQHVSLTLFHLCPCRFWKVLLALILGGPSKSCVFEKIYT